MLIIFSKAGNDVKNQNQSGAEIFAKLGLQARSERTIKLSSGSYVTQSTTRPLI